MPDDGKSAGRREARAHTPDWGVPFGAFLEGGQQAYARWLQTMCEFSQEIARFAQDRLQEDMTAWTTLATCHNPEQAMEWQRQFSTKAAAQYGEEIGKLSRMMTSMAVAGLFSMPQQRKSAGA
jgi:hypothetical protein